MYTYVTMKNQQFTLEILFIQPQTLIVDILFIRIAYSLMCLLGYMVIFTIITAKVQRQGLG